LLLPRPPPLPLGRRGWDGEGAAGPGQGAALRARHLPRRAMSLCDAAIAPTNAAGAAALYLVAPPVPRSSAGAAVLVSRASAAAARCAIT
jgi:hypothetical protein